MDFWQHLYLFTHSSNCNTILEVFRVWVLFVLFCRFLLYFADCHNCTERCNWDSSAKYSKKWQNKWLLLQPRLMKMITCQFLNLFTSIYLRSNRWQLTFPSSSSFSYSSFAFTVCNAPNCRFSLTILFPCKDRIVDSVVNTVLIRENTGQRKPVSWRFLRSGLFFSFTEDF